MIESRTWRELTVGCALFLSTVGSMSYAADAFGVSPSSGNHWTLTNSNAPAQSAEPKYLIFWSEPEKAGELAARVGMKGDGKTRLLGFGVPNATFELEAQLPNRIRSAFAAARDHGLAVMLHFDFHLFWKNRPDLWNWFDPQKPGLEPSIDDYSRPDPGRARMMKEDGVSAGPLGYRALLDRGFSADHPPDNFRQALAGIVQETVAFWCQQFVEAGIPAEKLYPHVAAPAPIEVMNAPIWTAFNPYSRPGWTTYAVEVLGQGFKPLYDELEKHGNPPWAGVEANAGMPGSVVDWETYLAWHYNHGCVLVGVNMGATGQDLPRRLWDSAFSEEAMVAYHKFLTGQPLVEKPLPMETPQIRIQAKMKRVRAGIERWQRSGKDPSAVGKIMEGAQPLANGGKLKELEKLVDQALEMLGETRQMPERFNE